MIDFKNEELNSDVIKVVLEFADFLESILRLFVVNFSKEKIEDSIDSAQKFLDLVEKYKKKLVLSPDGQNIGNFFIEPTLRKEFGGPNEDAIIDIGSLPLCRKSFAAAVGN